MKNCVNKQPGHAAPARRRGGRVAPAGRPTTSPRARPRDQPTRPPARPPARNRARPRDQALCCSSFRSRQKASKNLQVLAGKVPSSVFWAPKSSEFPRQGHFLNQFVIRFPDKRPFPAKTSKFATKNHFANS